MVFHHHGKLSSEQTNLVMVKASRSGSVLNGEEFIFVHAGKMVRSSCKGNKRHA